LKLGDDFAKQLMTIDDLAKQAKFFDFLTAKRRTAWGVQGGRRWPQVAILWVATPEMAVRPFQGGRL
jgi:hypothetical protein